MTKEKLESKQQEYQLLSEKVQDSKEQHHHSWKKDKEKDRQQQEKEVAYQTLLKHIIAKKKRKFEKLEEELRQKDSDLRSAQQDARLLLGELLQAQAEVKMKHEEVKKLQEKNEKLTCSYNIEKEQVSKLVQIMTTLTADKVKIEVCSHTSIFCLYISNSFVSIMYYIFLPPCSNN